MANDYPNLTQDQLNAIAVSTIMKGEVLHRRDGSRRYSAPDSVIESNETDGYYKSSTGSELLHDNGMWYLLVPPVPTQGKAEI